MDVLKRNNVFPCLCPSHIENTRRTLEGMVGVSRQGCMQTPIVLSTGTHMHVQRWLRSPAEDLAEAARVQAACVQTRQVRRRLLMSGYMHGRGLWQRMQGWKHGDRRNPTRVPGPL